MPKLKKSILPEGEYLVATPDGKRVYKKFDSAYLSTVVENTQKMIEAGLRIPAPFKHLKEAVPSIDEVTTDSFDNAGYWTSFNVVNENGKNVVYGEIDAPGDVSDMATPAGKLNNTIKEVSVCIKDSWVDGVGREWGPCILHCAPVLHPIVPGQDGFSLLDDAVALSISGLAEETTVENLAALSKEFEDSIGIYVPPDTILSDLPKVLMIALRQHKLSCESGDTDTEIIETQSVFMSLPEGTKVKISKRNAEYLLSLGAVNPKTNKPFEMEDFDVQERDDVETYALALTGELTTQRKNDLRTRVNKLIETGRTTKEYADKNLFPMVESYELSLGEGAKFQKNQADIIIESLESIPVNPVAPQGQQHDYGVPPGADVVQMSADDYTSELSADDAENLKKTMLSMMN